MKTKTLKRISVVFLAVLVMLSSMSLTALTTVRAEEDSAPAVTEEMVEENVEEVTEAAAEPVYIEESQAVVDVPVEADTAPPVVEAASEETAPEEAEITETVATSEETIVEETKVKEDETEVKMPAAEFFGSANGVDVRVKADEGTFPEGTTMNVTAVSTAQVYDTVNAVTEGEVSEVKAVDITFIGPDGKEIQPEKNVHMTMSVPGMAQDASIVHIDDNKKADIIESANIVGDNAYVEAESFSIYAVVEEGSTVDEARVTVVFQNGSTEITTMYVKNSDTAEELETILYDPGAGTVAEGQTFLGWYISDSETADYTTETTPLTIDGVRSYFADLSITEGMKKYVHAMIFNVYHVTFRNEQNVVVRSDLVLYPASQPEGTQVAYKINEPYTPEDIETTNFEGWNVISGSENIVDYTGQPYPNPSNITIKGDVGLHVNTPPGRWMNFVENGSGASFTPPVFYKTGVNTEAPTSPTRLGYTFDGWYENKECTGTAYTFGSPITQRVTLYAKWKPVENANYTVIIWKQKVSGTGYDFQESIVISNATVGQQATAVTAVNGTGNENSYARVDGTDKQYTGFHLQDYDQNVPVNPEGNTIVNVYYNRNTITLNFYTYSTTTSYEPVTGYDGATGNYYTNSSGTGGTTRVYYNSADGKWYTNRRWTGGWGGHYEYSGTSYDTVYTRQQANQWSIYKTLTGLYGSTFSDLPDIVWPSEYDWYANGGAGGSTSGTHTTFMDAFLISDGSNTDNFYGRAPQTGSTVRFYKQNEGGTGYSLANTVSTGEGGGSFSITDKYDGYHAVQYRVGNGQWQNVGTKNPRTGVYGNAVSYSNTLEIRYDRSTYDLTFMDGTYFDGQTLNPIEDEESVGLLKDVKNIAYGADISSYNKGGANYYDAGDHAKDAYVFAGWYVDESCTKEYTFDKMPKDGMTVYAKWVKKQYRIFLHPNVDPSETDFEWGAGDDQAMSFRVSYGEMISGGETINGTRTGYELVGWYYDAGFSQPFIFDAFALNDTTVTATYDQTQPTELDKYGNKTSDENKDATNNRIWVQRKLELYAKWRNTLEGANGINVVYDANGGTNAPTDTNLYLDQAKSVAQAASTAAGTDEQFLYWVVQTWDGSEFSDTGIHVFPGDEFTVLKANAKSEDNTTPGAPAGSKIYTVQLRAEYGPTEELTPTHIDWYANNTTTEKITDPEDADGLKINEAIDIRPADTFSYEGYDFIGWAKYSGDAKPSSPTDTANLWLFYDGSAFHLGSETGTVVEQVAADERKPYDSLHAIWKIKKFTVTWKSQDGATTYETDTDVPYGTAVSFDGTEPTKAADEQYTYTFAGWATEANQESGKQVSELPAVSGDATYYAAFSKTPRTHTVTWKSQDGETTYETDTDATHGSRPSFDGTEPTKPADAQYTYTFAGWATEANQETGKTVAELPDVTDDAVYYAAFSKETNKYTVIWKSQDGATTYETDTEDYGAAVSFDGTEPTKEADAQFTYTFEGWATESGQETGKQVSELPTVSGNVTYYASFSKTTNTYTVTWKSQDGSETYETDTDVPYGTAVSFDGTEPTKPADVQYTYTFAGWATSANAESGTAVANLPAVSGDATYYAAFSKVTNKYTVTYQYGGNVPEGAPDVPEPKEYEYGATVPKAAAPSVDGYTFSGWQGEPDTMPGNNVTVFGYWEAQVTAEVTATPKTVTYNGTEQTTTDADYTITYKVGGKAVAELPGIIVATIEVEHAKGTDAGNYTGEVSVQLQLMQRAMGYDVDSEVKKATLSLTINQAPLTITTPSATKEADGTALRAPITSQADAIKGLVNGETATVTATGSQTAAGSSSNTYSITWGTGKAANYKITENLGTLTVTAPAPTPPPAPPVIPDGPVVVPDGPTPAAPVIVPDDPTPQVEPTTPEEIDNDPTPKTNTKTWALLNLILSAITVILAIVMIITFATGSKDDDDDNDPGTKAAGAEDEEKKRQRNGLKFLGLIPAIGTVVLFFLTEDLTAKMAFTDKWTILTAVITVVGIVLTILIRNKKNNKDDEAENADA